MSTKRVTVQFQSKILWQSVTYTVLLPEGSGPHPVVLQLHGFGVNHTSWLQDPTLANIPSHYPSMIVLPDGENSYYLNLSPPPEEAPRRIPRYERYESFLMEELWQEVHETFHMREGRWAIGGASMGGYGAMRLGCKYPERFASIWAHFGPYNVRSQMEGFALDLDDADVYLHAERLASSPHSVAISFDCGSDDFLLKDNRDLHTHMEKIGLPHSYLEHAGGHDLVDGFLHKAFAQHHRIFEQENAASR